MIKAKIITITALLVSFLLCSCGHGEMTPEMAFEGVNNYCHQEYDWSIAEENPDIMTVAMGEESETEYQVVFRSYTGAFVHFYVFLGFIFTYIICGIIFSLRRKKSSSSREERRLKKICTEFRVSSW